ncbi:hypothetical protein RRF57_008086 [Xylaria bambusicola]|uniref:Uncharacterized protein n=1 Tax=Xylaria bambusicola TaxID=326684 RepID=A0AAN7Z6S4_9PEZI
MAAHTQTTGDESSPAPLFPPAPPSVISSRMTDIASEDGDAIEAAVKKANPTTESRPGTATGTSSARGGNWSQSLPLRKGLQRGSLSGSIASGRPLSSASKTSRSHVPLASQAFFRPMSSQKLQAQRAPRPPSLGQHRPSIDDLPDEDDQSHIAPHEVRAPATMGRSNQPSGDLADVQLPPSRGTENTEIYDRVTFTTSPTHGHYPAVSVTDSVSPLRRKQAEEKGLSLNLDKSNSYRNNANPLTPVKTPHSFRSSLFMPGMGDSSNSRPNHDMRGAEKLSSGASTPRPTSNAAEVTTKEANPNPRLGRNHEYFEGNTVFCLGGRLQNTRHRPINIGTGVLIVLPAALFFGGSAPYLWHHLSPAIPIIFAYLFIISLSSFIRASVSDPGVSSSWINSFPDPP